jgi:endogenous inhibitor of DNA gyrase (YacG/DUF329 family)
MIWWPGFCSQLFAPDTRLIGKNLEHSLTMARKRILKLRCPICKKIVKSGDPEFPFCSDRCRTIDLGKWASGAYVIASPITDADEQIRESTPEDSDEDL